MPRLFSRAFFFACWGWAYSLWAGSLPPLVLPEGVGVNIHFVTGHQRDLDLIATAGFKFIRMDFGWAGIERQKGQYEWDSYDELVANLEKRHLRGIFILDYSNGLYEPEILSTSPLNGEEQRAVSSPQNPESVAAYARWAAAAAKHFQGRGVVWEIWNEPNIGFWKPKPDVRQYITLALAACKALRAADEHAVIIGPTSSEFPWPFLDAFLGSGVLNYLDAVSVHPYRALTREPETVSDDYLKLRALIERHTPVGFKPVPIISSEWGYSSHTKGVSPSLQAAFLVRQQMINLLNGVPISIWYDWKNDGMNPDYNEDNFGTVNHDLSPKPAYRALQTLTQQFPAAQAGSEGYHIARRWDTERAEDYVLLFVNPAGTQKLAAWTTAGPHLISLPLDVASTSQLSAMNLSGAPLELKVDQGQVILELQSAPLFIEFHQRNPKLSAAASWSAKGPLPTLIEAGDKSWLRIPLSARNPFTNSIKFHFRLDSDCGKDSRVLRLKPGAEESVELRVSATRRTDRSLPVQVSAEIEETLPDRSIRSLGKSTDHRRFLVKNPLALHLMPIEQGFKLHLDNPSGSPFRGSVVVNNEEFPVQLSTDVTNFAKDLFIAGSSVKAEVLDGKGKLAADPVAYRFQHIVVPAISAALDGDSKVTAKATLAESAAPAKVEAPYTTAQRLDYSFEPGWRFVRCVPDLASELAQSQVSSLGMWVFGDSSNNVLRVRLRDAGGQTFQFTGPNLDWSGWRWVEFDLANLNGAGHWGGANDGVVRGGLRIDTLLLVDSSRNKTAGTIYFTGPVALYSLEAPR